MSLEIPWIIQDPTKIKHKLLKDYISPWMNILFQHQKRCGFPEILLYFDGFSGPGIYYEDNTKTATCLGSPAIVADIANKYIEEKLSRKVFIICIDKEKECVEKLKTLLDSANKYGQVWEVHHAEFKDKATTILDKIDGYGLGKQPMFFFIDPFGYSGYPLALIKRIIQYPRAEIFINFMVHDLVRFCEDITKEAVLLEQFGCNDFNKIGTYSNPEEKQAFLLKLYTEQSLTKLAGAEFVMPFRINTPRQGTRPRYYMIHVSKNYAALKLMKDRMAKISDSEYEFHAIGIKPAMQDFFIDSEDVKLQKKLLNFIKTSSGANNNYENIESWAYINTCGVSKTIKYSIVELEKKKKVNVTRLPRQRANTVADGAVIEFLSDY